MVGQVRIQPRSGGGGSKQGREERRATSLSRRQRPGGVELRFDRAAERVGRASRREVFFEGGGWCSDGTTCWGTKPAAANLTGYDATNFASDGAKNYPIFDRTLAGNPFATTSFG